MPIGFLYSIGFVIALLLALGMTPLVKKFAFKIGAIDKPNHRKVHTRIMPRMGGLAIYVAFVGAFLLVQPFIPEGLLRPQDVNMINALLVGGTIIIILGALDDRFELSAKVKLLGQVAAACVVVFGFNVHIDLVNVPFGETMQPIAQWIGIPLTILWIVGVTNAINLIDGLDGLAAGVSGIAIATIAIMASLMGFQPVILLSTLLLGGIIGFLVFNFHPAKIFMGDSGSLFLGFSLATLSMLGFKQVTIVSFVTPLLIIGVPLSDTFFAIVRRWVNKKPIFAPDRGHLHHRLRDLGFSHRRTVLIIWGVAALFGAIAIVQSAVVQSSAANWITFAVICLLMFFLQIGAELTGIVDKTRRPLINFLVRIGLIRTAKTQAQSRGK
ncbi:undecaprenyl-phosphate alpha-N-acetylglucosaminyl 1-phosphate transferase [Paenibacillus sp. MY03]|jgi:UDP-GlcNAc:undecaprenyl-phosphate GlcNAc-1-phosphate transferase|nr:MULTISPECIES: MraY family glycosyltransferase [Paenibacillus]OUS75169.1 undecaprenyl-phosphate alpha-N-acetylglucosaminyl 1-phosphate transferase [Paenibacillus sp. MY03]QNK58339.1 undecaprenyl/decaprenyl-phosphate alpha-N-acetylglucosaminyl 1-phosphate transferase [Paenibacillus sp. PAMC21692]